MISLLLITFEGQTYGIREEEVRQIEELPSLHRLPFSPGCIAGMAIRDGRTVTLADLSVCIGHGPVNQAGRKRLLLVPQEGLIKGFVVGEEIGRAEVAPEAVFPMPPYLRTDVVDRCALIDSLPVPLVNLMRLHEHLQNDADEAAAAPFTIPAVPAVLSEVGSYRIFAAGGDLFALPSELAEDDAAQEPGPIAAVRPVPKFVRGVTWHRSSLIPVFDLTQRMQLPHGQVKDLMLVGVVRDLQLGLLIDEDRGVVPSAKTALHQLPPIAATSWFDAALVLDGQVIPILDFSELFSVGAEEGRAASPSPAYTADASFPARFGKEEVEVTEFSLLGMRHAVPRSEQDAIIGFRPFRPIPGTLPIVAGIAEYEGSLLPVIDLATVFGRQSLPTSRWSMMVVQNGDFRALVLAENVFGDRRLGRDLQRAVPIALPHNVVYGCYLETDAVRLILNVHAMAVHFEASLVEELLPVLSRHMEQLPAGLVSERTGEPVKVVPAASAVEDVTKTEITASASAPSRDGSAESPALESISASPAEELSQTAALVAAVHEAGTPAEEGPDDSTAEMELSPLPQEAAGESGGITNIAAGSQDMQVSDLPGDAVEESELQPLPQEPAEESSSTDIAATPREGQDITASETETSAPELTADIPVEAAKAREESENVEQVIMKGTTSQPARQCLNRPLSLSRRQYLMNHRCPMSCLRYQCRKRPYRLRQYHMNPFVPESREEGSPCRLSKAKKEYGGSTTRPWCS